MTKKTKQVKATITVEVTIDMDKNIDANDVLSEMDYDFTDMTGKADFINCEIVEWDVY